MTEKSNRICSKFAIMKKICFDIIIGCKHFHNAVACILSTFDWNNFEVSVKFRYWKFFETFVWEKWIYLILPNTTHNSLINRSNELSFSKKDLKNQQIYLSDSTLSTNSFFFSCCIPRRQDVLALFNKWSFSHIQIQNTSFLEFSILLRHFRDLIELSHL